MSSNIHGLGSASDRAGGGGGGGGAGGQPSDCKG